MTEEELEELIHNCPKLYHMAERNSWPAIQKEGLLSTSALLDRYEISGSLRTSIEEKRRPKSVQINNPSLPSAVIRDQIPMTDKGLQSSLPNNITPTDWYKLLNSKVFFWLTKERLFTLTGARSYRDREHDVLEVCTHSLIKAYREKIWLCRMNSGCTEPWRHSRDYSIFSRICSCPYSYWKKRSGKYPVVELAVDYAVPDIENYVSAIHVAKGKEFIYTLPARPTPPPNK